MDASAKKNLLISQLMNYFEQDASRLVQLGEGLKMLGIDTNDSATLDRIAQYPEYFTTLISYSELGLLTKMKQSVDIIKGDKI